MRFHASRIIPDLRRGLALLAAATPVVFIASLILAYLAAFTLPAIQNFTYPQGPGEESRLGFVDLESRHYHEVASFPPYRLRGNPISAELVDMVADHPGSFLRVDVGELWHEFTDSTSGPVPSGVVIVSHEWPGDSSIHATPGETTVWSEARDNDWGSHIAAIIDTAPVVEIQHALPADHGATRGALSTEENVALIHPTDATQLRLARPPTSEWPAEQFSCDCTPADMDLLIDGLNTLGSTQYYAVQEQSAPGIMERSSSIVSLATLLVALMGTISTLLGFLLVRSALWYRYRRCYAIEAAFGAKRFGFVVRQSVLILLAATAPAAAALFVTWNVLGEGPPTADWDRGVLVYVGLALIVVHLTLTAISALTIYRKSDGPDANFTS